MMKKDIYLYGNNEMIYIYIIINYKFYINLTQLKQNKTKQKKNLYIE